MSKGINEIMLKIPLSAADASLPYMPTAEKGSVTELCERAEHLARNNRHKEALRTLSLAIKKSPRCQSAYHLRGYSLISLRRFGAALAAFRKCLSLTPQRSYYNFYLGKVYSLLKKYHLAINSYRKALDSKWPFEDKDFSNAVIYRQMGLTYITWRKPGEALWCYEKVFSLGDYFGAPLRKRALTIAKRGIKAKAPIWAQLRTSNLLRGE